MSAYLDCTTCARAHSVRIIDPVLGVERIDCPHTPVWLYRWAGLVWNRPPFRAWGAFGRYVCSGQVTACPGWSDK